MFSQGMIQPPITHSGATPLFVDAAPTERRILLAALDAFVDRGVHGARIPEIARRAGIATGTIYLYFPSKERLASELVARLRGRIAAELARRAAPAPDTDGSPEAPAPPEVRRQFDAIWDVFAGFMLEHERAMAFLDLHMHGDYVGPDTMASWAPARELLVAHFTAGRAAGVYRDLPPQTLRATMAGVLIGAHKFSRMGELELDAATLERLREAAWDAVSRGETRP